MKIRDLVSVDATAEFRSDVQLSDFDDPEVNPALVQSYIFTHTAPAGQESTVGVMRIATEALMNARLANRLAVVANYGHGKSHLALVLANYFSKPANSPELKNILNKLSLAIQNEAQAARYAEFRKNHAEYLVLRLRGDVPYPLREQFLTALEQALKEHTATHGAKVPHWYEGAEQFLVGLKGDNLAKANQYLEPLGTEVKLLLDDVRRRREAAYDRVQGVSRAVHGFPLHFGEQVSMAKLLKWAVSTYCGEGKPLAGVVVLFDEFSLYVMNYAQRNAAGELQDLLNGIENHKGSALFMAFAQHDPVGLAHRAGRAGEAETLEKELTRIDKRVSLYSLMESVVDSYLTQPERAWLKLRADPQLRGPLARASSQAMDVFSRRYERTLKWEPEQFDKIVTRGCFPLHPITTAMLCDLQLRAVQTAGNPRTVLGFVLDRVREKEDEPAAHGKRINWVLPIDLVDYFREYLPEDAFGLYSEACRHLPGDAPDEQVHLLKALLLQTAARLSVRYENQKDFLAEASGVDRDQAAKYLRALSDNNIIQWDPGTKLYQFLPSSVRPHRLEELLQKHLTNRELTWELLQVLEEGLTSIKVEVAWGNPEDWAAAQHVLSRAFLDVSHLRELITSIQVSGTGDINEADRGCVVWLLAQSEEDVTWFRKKATGVLDEAFPGENPPPAILMLPDRPVPALVEALLRRRSLKRLTQEERQEVGDAFGHEEKKQDLAIEAGLAALRGDALNYPTLPRAPHALAAPAAYRATLQAAAGQSLQKQLSTCYGLAYRYSPPEFFPQYRSGGRGPNALRTAVRMISGLLLRNSLTSNRQGISASPVARDLTEKILLKAWKVVTPDWRLQEPTSQRLKQAWKLLDTTFGAGRQEVALAPVMTQLLNPPYGYDVNTLSLLFAAWVGYNANDLQISLNGQQAAWEKVADELNSSRGQLVNLLLPQHTRLSRRDQAEVERQVKDIIKKAKRGSHSQTDAKYMLASLQAYLTDYGPTTPSAPQAQEASEHLRQALETAQGYDRAAREVSAQLNQEKNALALIGVGTRIKNLPQPGNVVPLEPSVDDLESRWLTGLEAQVNEACQSLEAIQRLAQLDRNKAELDELKKRLRSAGLAELARRVDKSVRAIERRGEQLEREAQEAPTVIEIQAMNRNSRLADLYGYRDRLGQLSGLSGATKQLRDDKAAEVGGAIKQHEAFAKGLLAAVDELADRAACNDWLRQYYRSHEQYNETPLYGELQSAGDRVERLQQFYADLEPLAGRRPKRSDELAEAKQRLAGLSAAAELLGKPGQAALRHANQQLDQHASALLSQARAWLDNFEYKLKDAPTSHWIRDHLQSPPVYMLSEDQARWVKLQQAAQERLDQDVLGRIESLFLEIRDPAVRKACLERLQDIMGRKSER